MLCQFSFQNYKSYKAETTFDFQAAAIPEFSASLLGEEKSGRLLPVGVVYGPNGGGKSNLLQALSCLITTVVKPNEQRVPQIGEVYMMNFGGSGSEQNGWRPGVVFQNNVGNAHSPNIIALPLTSSIKKSGQPTHVIVKSADSGLRLTAWFCARIPNVCRKNASASISPHCPTVICGR